MHETVLIDRGGFSRSPEWATIRNQILRAIRAVEWPLGAGSFALYPELGKGRGKGNGVTPIKTTCMQHLVASGWNLETTVDIATRVRPGKMDATCHVADKLFCFEWETGNVSSSHRALDKMAFGLIKGILVGGVLVVPTRTMARYLTDRVGNYEELTPYFPFWQAIQVTEGYLAIMGIEHDALSEKVPRIPKGTDGRALQ